jgi:hypothetical protein
MTSTSSISSMPVRSNTVRSRRVHCVIAKESLCSKVVTPDDYPCCEGIVQSDADGITAEHRGPATVVLSRCPPRTRMGAVLTAGHSSITVSPGVRILCAAARPQETHCMRALLWQDGCPSGIVRVRGRNTS